MKTAISIPDEVFKSADRLAKRLRMSRSELYSKAVAQYVADHPRARVTGLLNEVYAGEDSSLDPVVASAQAKSLGEGGW